MKRNMPDLNKYDGTDKTYGAFWRYVWNEYGCYTGLSPRKYFETCMELYSRIPNYTGLGLEMGVERSVGEIIQTMKQTYVIPHIVLNGKHIKELRFSFDDNFTLVNTTKIKENESIVKEMVELRNNEERVIEEKNEESVNLGKNRKRKNESIEESRKRKNWKSEERENKQKATVKVGLWVLALQWCIQDQRFTIPGLWAQGNLRKNRSKKKTFAHTKFPSELVENMKRNMPDLNKYDGTDKTYVAFWRYVWNEYGCYTGLSPRKYFETCMELYSRISNYTGLGLEMGAERSVGEIIQTMKQTYVIPHIVLDGKHIKELRFSFDDNFTLVNTTKIKENESIIKEMVELRNNEERVIEEKNEESVNLGKNRKRKNESIE